MLPFVRPDALPEKAQYRDDGCEYSASCLGCRLRLCRYDDPGYILRENQAIRAAAIRRCRRNGEAIPVIATRFEVSERTVYRVTKSTVSGKR